MPSGAECCAEFDCCDGWVRHVRDHILFEYSDHPLPGAWDGGIDAVAAVSKAVVTEAYDYCVGDLNIAGDLLPLAHYVSLVRPTLVAAAATRSALSARGSRSGTRNRG
jgi:hypothetical protein